MSTIPSVPLPTQPAYQQYLNPGQMTDMIMNNMLIAKIGDVMNADFAWSPVNAIKLLLFLSSGEIKNGVSTLVAEFINCLRATPGALLKTALYLSTLLKKQDNEMNTIPIIVKDNNSHVININMEKNFAISLCEYISKNKNCTFEQKICGTTIKNTKENIINIQLSNIKIDFLNYDLEIVETISYHKDIYTDEISLVECSNNNTADPQIQNYLDLLSPEQREIVGKIYDQIIITNKTPEKFCPVDTAYTKEGGFSENNITDLLVEKYPTLNKHVTLTQIIILGSIYYQFFKIACISTTHTSLKKGCMPLFDRYNKYNLLEEDKYKIATSCINQISSKIIVYIEVLKIDHNHIVKIFQPLTVYSNELVTVTPFSPNIIITPKLDQKIDPQTVISDFINMIYKSYKKNTTKTKIFSVKLENDVKTTESPNPAYEEYEDKKKILEQMKCDNTPSNLAMLEFINKPIPPKTIVTEVITKKIECKLVNEIEKHFDTLFLKNKDRHSLTNSLDMFKNKGHVLQEMGLQHKFNLLLYGEPGTGKSTTIQAVANYLQRDIYYVDIQQAVTNEDLHTIFQYIYKNVSNSGIAVIEDIDAATDIVKKRTGKVITDYKVSDVINNQKNALTLEFFLNILQGTLTVDNSVFIVTTNHIDHLDEAFCRDGRFDVKIELQLCDKFQIKCIYLKMMGKDLPDKILDKIVEYKHSPASVIYHIKNYIFSDDVEPEEIMKPFITNV